MKRWMTSAALLLATVATPIPVAADQGGEQAPMRRATQGGSVRSLREIERDVLPTMPGSQYLGPEYDPAAMAYRLKFIRDGHVLYVDVDARTGRVIGKSR